MFQKGELRLLWPIYLSALFNGLLSLTFPFFVVYYQGRGLTFTDIGVLFAVMSVIKILFEVPTGVIADVFGRKFSSFLGTLLVNILWIFIPLTKSYAGLLLVLACISAAQTLISGAHAAWVYDLLKAHGKKKLIAGFYAKQTFLLSSGAVVGSLLGAYLASRVGLDLLFIIEGVAGIVFIATPLLLASERWKPRSAQWGAHITNALTTARDGFSFNFRHIRVFMALSALIAVFGSIAIDQLATQPMLTTLGLPIPALGVVYAVMSGVAGVPGLVGVWLAKRLRERTIFILSSVVLMGISAAVALLVPGMFIAGAILLLAHTSLINLKLPLLMAHIDHLIPSRVRATVLSAQSMLMHLAWIVVFVASGIVNDAVGPVYGYALGGLLLVPALIVFLRMPTATHKKQAS